MDSEAPQGNPYNDQPTVRLLDADGHERGLISQREANRLLRSGRAELVLRVPPAVRVLASAEDLLALLREPSGQAGEKGLFLHARRSQLYGNVHFQSPAGERMFNADSEKALWYLNRGLVEVVSTDPPVLRFRFNPGGRGHAGDSYYLGRKANCCVVCGAEEGLNRHHVVPSVYRRHLPAEVKDHSHHDVVLLCLGCHEKYEREADALKIELGREVGVPLHGLRGERDPVHGKAIRFAGALTRYGRQIPEARREEMLAAIADHLGHRPDEAEVAALAREMGCEESGRVEHGPQVVANSADVQAFIRRWRGHFLRSMHPQFMPEHWDVDRPARPGEKAEGTAGQG